MPVIFRLTLISIFFLSTMTSVAKLIQLEAEIVSFAATTHNDLPNILSSPLASWSRKRPKIKL